MTTAQSEVNPDAEPQVQTLQCMEVWSGHESFHNSVSVPGIDVWVDTDPFQGDTRGGDVHYVSVCGAGRLSRFAVADVSGHGAVVDEMAERLRVLMRKHINTLDQTKFARALNREFARLQEAGRFATALLTSYYTPTDHLVVCNAGHPRTLWFHHDTGAWTLLDQTSDSDGDAVNLPLGIIEPTDYVQFAVKLGRGDLILIYTDALVEASDPEGRMLGEQGLLDLVSGIDTNNPEAVSRRVAEAIAAHRSGAPADDDQTIIVLHHNAADPPPMSLGEKLKTMAKMIGL